MSHKVEGIVTIMNESGYSLFSWIGIIMLRIQQCNARIITNFILAKIESAI